VQLSIYNIRGRKVLTLVDEPKAPGFYRTTFDARNLPSGMYIYRIRMKNFVKMNKMLLLK
jgi:hypothetical protein